MDDIKNINVKFENSKRKVNGKKKPSSRFFRVTVTVVINLPQ